MSNQNMAIFWWFYAIISVSCAMDHSYPFRLYCSIASIWYSNGKNQRKMYISINLQYNTSTLNEHKCLNWRFYCWTRQFLHHFSMCIMTALPMQLFTHPLLYWMPFLSTGKLLLGDGKNMKSHSRNCEVLMEIKWNIIPLTIQICLEFCRFQSRIEWIFNSDPNVFTIHYERISEYEI